MPPILAAARAPSVAPLSRPGLATPLRLAGKLLSSFSKYVLTPLPSTKNSKLILLLIKFISKDYLAEEK